jgi:hypothetical protein
VTGIVGLPREEAKTQSGHMGLGGLKHVIAPCFLECQLFEQNAKRAGANPSSFLWFCQYAYSLYSTYKKTIEFFGDFYFLI